ncbi:MAG: hypothetical protein HZB33_04165 [Nitrospirae bacterium]|nr:hypothetical protein [Nitrospirota bacterium]
MKSAFFHNIIHLNGLDLRGFREWSFLPGMLFNSGEKWWGDRSERGFPHEGLDLCCYLAAGGEKIALGSGVLVPSLYDGAVASVADDYIGKTIFLRHPQFSSGVRDFFTIYGHTDPLAGIKENTALSEGTPLAIIAAVKGRQSGPPPHLHISAAFISKEVPAEELGWKMMRDTDRVRLIDPLPLL